MLTEKKQIRLRESTAESINFEVGESAPRDWDAFMDAQGQSIFFTKRWNEVLARGYSTPVIYYVCRIGEEIKLVLSGIIYDFKFSRLFFSNMPHGGFVGDFKYLPRFLEFIELDLKKKRIHHVRLTALSESVLPNLPSYRRTEAPQHSLSLAGLDPISLWEGYRKNNRRDIRLARRRGVTLRRLSGGNGLTEYSNLYSQTMKRNRSVCHYTRKLLETICHVLDAKGEMSLLVAEYQKKMIAGVIVIYGKNVNYLLSNVSDPQFLSFCPNDLLYHELIEEAIEQKKDFIDFMMSGQDDRNLIWFKEKWGAQSQAYFIFEKDLDPLRAKAFRGLLALANAPLLQPFVRRFQKA